MNRRDCLKSITAASGAAILPQNLQAAEEQKFALNYVLSTALYGDMKLRSILEELEFTGASGLDIWGKPHGSQREEIDKMGIDAFAQLLKSYNAKVLVSSRSPLGCFGLQAEMPILQGFGGKVITSASPIRDPRQKKEAKNLVLRLIENMIPHADAAREHGLKIAIQNHPDQIIAGPDEIRYFAEFNRHPSLGLALAPHYLKDNTKLLPELILELGNENLPFIYFQEYGDGAFYKIEKQIELEQMPGRGTLSYTNIVRALKLIEFDGLAEISMHPNPLGEPVLSAAEEITELFNESRIHVDSCIKDLS